MVYLGDTKGSGEENKNQTNNNTTPGGEENKNQPSGTTGGEENENQPSGTTGNEENENQTGDSPVLGSQLTYTGASLNVADANDDEETRDESTTVLKRAAENFKNTAENVTNYVIKIINKATGNDNTLNVTLENVNIDVSREYKDAASASRARATRRSRSRATIPSPATANMPASSTMKRARMTTMILLTPAN